jgi:hypothetical protein
MPVPAVCKPLEDRVKELERDLRDLQADLKVAAPADRPAIAAQIGKVQAALTTARDQLASCVKANPPTPPPVPTPTPGPTPGPPAPAPHPPPSRQSTLYPGEALRTGHRLLAPTEPVTLDMQTDGNLVTYRADLGTALWASGTAHPDAQVIMQTDGNLVVYDPSGTPRWASHTDGYPGAHAAILDNGNLVIYDSGGDLLWSTNAPYTSPLPSGPLVISSAPGRLDLIQQSVEGNQLYRRYDGGWQAWEDLGGVLTSRPAAASWGDGRVDLFHRGEDAGLWHKAFDPSIGGWSDWESLGGQIAGPPAAVAPAPGRLEVFAQGPDGILQQRTFNGGWQPWASRGGVLTSAPSVVSRDADHIDVFARGADDTCRHLGRDTSGWGQWESLGGELPTGPTALSSAPGTVQVFHLGYDHVIYRKSRSAGSGWSAWEPTATLGGAALAPPTGPQTGGASLMGKEACDRDFAECCGKADKIQDDVARNLAFIDCNIKQRACYGKDAATKAVDWVSNALGEVTGFLGAHPEIVIGLIVVAAVVVVVAAPPAAPLVLTVLVL